MQNAAQQILPSAHLLEIFMPYRNDEPRMVDVLKRAADLGYYRGAELGVFFAPDCRRQARGIVEGNKLNLAVFITPYLKERRMHLCSLDAAERKKAVDYTRQLAALAAEQGCNTLGLPSGDDPGDEKREAAKAALAESIGEIAALGRALGLNITIEPLDRYAYKKQLIGPMAETVEWFAPLHRENPNFFIHWDSAHEALGGIDLMESIDLASPYIAQFHLCNAILDPAHPCFGDLHMDVGVAPDYATEGFLTPETGAAILRRVAYHPKPEGVRSTYASVEVLGHPGDDLWRKERISREFLQRCFERSGL